MYPRRGRGRGRPKLNKEEISEDYCFVCKDGGDLVICDFKDCIKAYHPYCVQKDKEFFDSGKRWVCHWHSCFICRKSSAFHCLGCTSAVCRRCIKSAEFVHIRGRSGFCSNCLSLAILIEQKVDVDPEGGKVDFNDRDTYECLFKEYWYIINGKERLTLEDLYSADKRLKKGVFFKNESDSDQFEGDEDQDFDESMDSMMDIEPGSWMGKGMKVHTHTRPMKISKPKKREFDGWGSKALRDFLKKIGKDSDNPISQNEVEDIIKKYVTERKLMDSDKKKMVRCDTNLLSIFGRKLIKRNKVYGLLESHFAENLEQSEEDESCCSDDNEDAATVSCKRQRRMNSTRKTTEKEKVLETPQSLFASVTAENIKLVYLRRSLIEDLLKNSETFEEKVAGSFIRVRSDPNDYFQKNPYQLMQVTGITMKGGENNEFKEVTLNVSNARKGFQICMLSDENFLEEEIEDLHKKVEEGLLKKLTIVELERKARILHKDLTKHVRTSNGGRILKRVHPTLYFGWIKKELVRLQNLSDRANEKGWRYELRCYLEEIKKLQTASHQQQLIQEVPKIIAEKVEHEVLTLDLCKDGNLVKDNLPTPILLPGNSASLVDITGAEFDDVVDDIPKNEEGANLNPVMPDWQKRAGGQDCIMDIIDTIAAEKGTEEKIDAIDVESIMLDVQNIAEDKVGMDIVGETAAVKGTEENGEATFNIPEQDVHEFDDVVDDIPKNEEGANLNPVMPDWQKRAGGQDCMMDIIDTIAAEKGTEEKKDAIDVDSIMLDVQNIAEDKVGMDIVGETAAVKGTEENGEATFNISEQDVHGKHLGIQVSEGNSTGRQMIVSDEKEKEIGTANEKKPSQVPVDVIDLDSDDDDDEITDRSVIWYYVDPEGVTQGPFSLSQLRAWYDHGYFDPDFKVWKGELKEQAILLKDALGRI